MKLYSRWLNSHCTSLTTALDPNVYAILACYHVYRAETTVTRCSDNKQQAGDNIVIVDACKALTTTIVSLGISC